MVRRRVQSTLYDGSLPKNGGQTECSIECSENDGASFIWMKKIVLDGKHTR